MKIKFLFLTLASLMLSTELIASPMLPSSTNHPFALDVIVGAHPGYKVIRKFGNNPEIDNTESEDVWSGGGDYTGMPLHSAAAETVECFSDSAADNGSGTGAQSMLLKGHSDLWAEQSVTLTLNGTTPVATTEKWHRLPRGKIELVGTYQKNVGTITCRHTTTTANIFIKLLPDLGQTQISAWTVPLGHKGVLKRFRGTLGRAAAAGSSAKFRLWIREPGKSWRAIVDETITTSVPLDQNNCMSDIFPEKTDIRISMDAVTANDTSASGSFTVLYVREP